MKNNDNSTKQRLIHAAKKLFAQYNFDYVSTRMIAAEANTAQSNIFFHFGSKENLCAAIIEDILKYHQIYYAPIKKEMEDAIAAQSLTPELALELLEEYIRVQIQISFDTHNKSALSFSINGHTLPKDITKPLFDDIKESIDIPMAKLLCAYKQSSNLAGAYTVCHSANASLVAFNFTSTSNIMEEIKELGTYKNDEDIHRLLYYYVLSALKSAPI